MTKTSRFMVPFIPMLAIGCAGKSTSGSDAGAQVIEPDDGVAEDSRLVCTNPTRRETDEEEWTSLVDCDEGLVCVFNEGARSCVLNCVPV